MIEKLTQEAIELLKNLISKQSFSGEENETALLIMQWFSHHNIQFESDKHNVWAKNKHFNSSKILINKHEEYLKKYVITLTVNDQVQKSINIIKQNRGQDNSKFFEAKLLLLIDNFKKREFDQNIKLLNDSFYKIIKKFSLNYLII